MSEPVAPAEAPVASEAPVAAPKMAPLNRDIPLSQQTGKIMKMMESLPEKKEEPVKEVKDAPKEDTKDAPKDDVKKDVKTDTSEDTSSYFDEEDEPEVKVTPLEAKTWQEYVSKGIQSLTIVGKVGDELKEFKAFTEDQLPADFQFNSDVDRLKYSRQFDRLERKAESLQQEFFQKQQQENIRQFEVQEAKDISSDLGWLQARGFVPKFQYEETDGRFNSDPAVKEANAIYDLYKKTNNEYAQKYMGTNRSFRISYRDAADKFYATKARTAPKEPVKPAEKTPIQKQRDEIGGKVGAPQSGDAHTIKPRAFSGMTMTDINRLAKAGKI
jgi:hypothetical protein